MNRNIEIRDIESYLKKGIVNSNEKVINLYDLQSTIVSEIEKYNFKSIVDFQKKMSKTFETYSFIDCFYKDEMSSLMLGIGDTNSNFRYLEINLGKKDMLPSVKQDNFSYTKKELEFHRDFFTNNMSQLSDILVSLSSCGTYFESNIDYNEIEALNNLKINIFKDFVLNLNFEDIRKQSEFFKILYNGATVQNVLDDKNLQLIKKFILENKDDLLSRSAIDIDSLPTSYQKVINNKRS